MHLDAAFDGARLLADVPGLLQSGEIGLLRLLHGLGLAHDAHGQPAWPFVHRIAIETLTLDAGLARQVAWMLACLALALLLLVLAGVRRRLRIVAAAAAVVALLTAPRPPLALILSDAQDTSFHRSPTGFEAASIAAGLALYQTHCVECHGADGRGEGPRAASLPTWPPRLDGQLLWNRAEGEVFARILRGMRDREGTQTMPGFGGRLSDAQIWSLIDGMKALAAGTSVRDDATWAIPVRAPDALVHCDDGSADRPLRHFRGERVRLVAEGPAAAPRREDPRLVTIAILAPGAATPAGCSIAGAAPWNAYAEVGGAPVDAFAGAQLLVDRDGWLRAYGQPGRAGWSQDDFICRSTRSKQSKPPAAQVGDGLGELIAAIDADPIRETVLGAVHGP
jgi:mono/diheme cytochrome c family protein